RVELVQLVVEGAVEHAHLPVDDVVEQVAAELEARVTVGRELVRDRALREEQVGGRLQALEAERRLELAAAQRHPWLEGVDVEVGVVELRLVVPEVGHDLVVEVLVDRALDDRPHATKPDLVRSGVAALLRELAELRLQVAAELELEVTARRLEEEAILPAG